ncbi:MAG TPA: amino acid adenylation domain-containing protein, partial [Pyrinomonadaceae bacterium]|nr:amino acid adenylation domain-containing protein [Pyrinomonadaceae bacterium]
ERRVRAADVAANAGSLIGRPISDLRGYVLDQQMELLPPGVPGELYVGGAGVARGYLSRAGLSAERFVPDPFSRVPGARLYRTGDLVRYRRQGDLEYLGRVDQQVKIRGFRIEPGEIESVLEQHEEVREAVVIASEDDSTEQRLIAYIVPESNHTAHADMVENAELSAEQVAQWEMVFNETYSHPASLADPTFNITGWTNSYTGEPIAEEEMRDWVDQTVERIRSLQPQRVLEIGCGTGLLLFRVAPHCTRYVATDFSPIALDYIQQTLSLRNEDVPQLELLQRPADNFAGIEAESFDLVILNSVVQYFPSIDYLVRVIEGAVQVVKRGGAIFIGDVRSLPLLEAFHLAVQSHQAPALPVAELEQRAKRHMAQEEELIIDPAFFAALRQHFSQIGNVEVLQKRERYQNEMTQFRYDVLLRVGEAAQDHDDVSLPATNGDLKPWSSYANNPLEGRFARRLVPKLRSFLHEQLPDYMVPSAFVLIDAMPLTQHGKINRRALPAPEQSRPELEDIYVAPRTPNDKKLAALFAHVLGVNQVGLHDNFFDLGGHSLLATQLLSRIRETFPDKEITLRHIFDSPTVAGLAREIESTAAADQNLPPLKPAPRDQDLPLSFAQQRLWFLDQLEKGSAVYNCPAAVRFHGALNIAALEQSLGEVVRRHEVLRTSFVSRDGSPAQVIASSFDLKLPLIDLSGLPRQLLERELHRFSLLEAQRPFDLAHGPLLRTKLLRVSEAEHVVLLAMHHIVSDGWSIGVLVKEVAALYAAFAGGKQSMLEPLPVQYADYAYWERAWLQGDVFERQLEYWKQQLDGAQVLELPADRPRPPVQTYRGGYGTFNLDRQLADGLNELSRHLDATLFMTLLAAWQTLLHRYSGQQDIVVGSPIANRQRAETERLIGFFVNTLALRTNLGGNPPFAEVVRRVRETALGAYAHQSLPFERLIEELQPERDASHTPLVQVVFALQNAPQADLTALDLKLNYVEGETGTAKFDLTLTLQETSDGLSGRLEYRSDLFEPATIERLLVHYENLLRAVITNPAQTIAELPLLTSPERRQLLAEWNDTATAYPREQSIHELFEAQVASEPEAVAAISNDVSLSYRELNARANQLAWLLRKRGVAPETLVGISLPRSERSLIALLGILKAGGAYVFLDPAYPAERLALMVHDAAIRLLVTEEHLQGKFSTVETVICLDAGEAELASQPVDNLPENFFGGQQLAYVSYTSGSTGTPKGVAVTHQGVVRLVKETNFASLTANSVFLQLAPVSFDASTLELWGPLLNGGRCVLPREQILSARELREAIQRYRINSLWLTSLMFNTIVDEDVTALEGLQQLLVGGEALSAPHVMRARKHLPQTQLINGYGPTENTTFTCCYPIGSDLEPTTSSIPIGTPIANTEVYILDSGMQPVPIGVTGELYVAGDGLARGYVSRPELTTEHFVPNPFGRTAGERLYRTGDLTRWRASGDIEFVGRRDRQIKLRGFRIELGEVEAALKRIAKVREAVVGLTGKNSSAAGLVAYVVADDLTEPEIHSSLQAQLPAYMVPRQVLLVERLPLTRHGKVDEEQLRLLVENIDRGEEGGPPVTEVERTVAEIWGALLGLENPGRDANFFLLGGHSLLATQVMVRVQRALGVELPLRTLFEKPTVAEFSAQVEISLRSDAAAAVPPLVRAARDEEMPLSFAQQRIWFLFSLDPESPAYNMPAALRLNGDLDVPALEQSLKEIVRRHEMLRTTFAAVDGRPVQRVANRSELHLRVVDLRVIEPDRREPQVMRLAHAEAHRPFDLGHAPLLRVTLLRVGEQEHVVLFTMHHIICDGWSVALLMKEVTRL